MKRVVLYARESPSLAENEDTIDSQIQAIKEKITEDQNILVDQYNDNGWAGDLLARPELDRLRDDAMQHKFEVVYFFDRSRLARKYWLQELVLEELEEKSIEVIFLKEPKAETDEDKVVQGIKGLFAEYERAKITERTRRGRLYRAKNGLLVGNEAPFGYSYVRQKDSKERWYEVVEEEARVVKMIFNWLAYDGMSLRAIIKKLFELKIKPKNGNESWASSTLSRLVRREDYIGKAYYNKSYGLIPAKNGSGYKRRKKTSRKYKSREDWLPIAVPSIIDKETFELAQNQLQKNQLLSPRNLKRKYLLRGLIFCDKCKSRFAGEAKGEFKYYRSTLRLRTFPNKVNCNCKTINANTIDSVVWDSVKKLLSNPDLIISQYNQRIKKVNSNKDNIVGEIKDINNKLIQINSSEKRLVDAYTAGVLNLEQIKDKSGTLKMEKSILEREKEKLQTLIEGVNNQELLKSTDEICSKFTSVLNEIGDSEKDTLLHLLLKEIMINENNLIIRGHIPVEVPKVEELRSNLYHRRPSRQGG